MAGDPNREPMTEAQLRAVTIGEPTVLDGPITLVEPDPDWPERFEHEAAGIRTALGETVLGLEHVGSTSVPGLPAKPIIDMALTVPDSADEPAYVPPLERIGFVLRIREPDLNEHRVLVGPDRDINVHVFTAGDAEVDRMVALRDRLRHDADAHELYRRTKRELAGRRWRYVQNYADAKSEVIDEILSLPPLGQYATDRNLRARSRLWEQQQPPFDLVAWVLEIAGLSSRAGGGPVLDVGCGYGRYVHELGKRRVAAIGLDLSVGMLEAARPHPGLVNADATALPFPGGVFDVVLAPHMLYHVDDMQAAAAEMRRVLRPAGRCVVVTNGHGHASELRELIEDAAGSTNPGWTMRNPSTHDFALENGATILETAFGSVALVRPDGVPPARLADPGIAADYVASVGDLYESEIDRPWNEVVEHVRDRVAEVIHLRGEFLVTADAGAFVCG